MSDIAIIISLTAAFLYILLTQITFLNLYINQFFNACTANLTVALKSLSARRHNAFMQNNLFAFVAISFDRNLISVNSLEKIIN